MKRHRLIPLLLVCLFTESAAVPAEPSLAERVRAANIWQRLARHGDDQYLMVTQPSPAETALARTLGVPPSSFDAAAVVLGRPIAFNAADATGGVNEFGAGILDRRVEGNALTFRVGDTDAYLAWGNFDGRHAEYGVKPFGVAYQWLRNGREYASTFAVGEPFGIYLRVRQSQKESTWRIVAQPNPDLAEVKGKLPPGGYVAEFKVTGTDWQTISAANVRGRSSCHPAPCRAFVWKAAPPPPTPRDPPGPRPSWTRRQLPNGSAAWRMKSPWLTVQRPPNPHVGSQN